MRKRDVLRVAISEAAPVDHILQLHDPVVVHVAIVVFLVSGRHEGMHVWTPERGGQQLREAHVRDAESAYAAVAPRLSAYPLLRVVAILDFAHIRVPGAVRVIPPAAIL